MSKSNCLNRIVPFLLGVSVVGIFACTALAADVRYLTYAGRIVDDSGNPLNGSVQFNFKITDSVGTCVFWEENLTDTVSAGVFSLQIGRGTNVFDGAGASSLEGIFKQGQAINCKGGSPSANVTPANTDDRNLVMSFNDGSGWQTIANAIPIRSVPYALFAENVANLVGYPIAVTAAPTNGQVLQFQSGTNSWVPTTLGGGGGGLSQITAATSTDLIDNANFAQTWNWSTATTQNPMSLSADALTTGSLLKVTTSSPALNSSSGLLNVANTGTSTNGIVARIQSNSTVDSGLTVLANGNVGIGTSTPASPLSVLQNSTATGAVNVTANSVSLTANPAAASAANFFGMTSTAVPQGSANMTGSIEGIVGMGVHSGTGTVTNLNGVEGDSVNGSTGVITNARGLYGQVMNVTSGTITNAYSGQFQVTRVTGTITNAYGVYIGSVAGTNKWSMYASDATAPSYFAGNVGIGTPNPGALLDVNGTMRVNQICDSTGANCKTVSGGWGGGAAGLSSLTAATATDTIDNTNFAQTWNWSTATTQNPMSISANALTTGSLLNLTSSSASLNSTNGLLSVVNSGASTSGTVARIQSNSTAGSGLTVLANGNVGIGTTNPLYPLSVIKNSTVVGPVVNTYLYTSQFPSANSAGIVTGFESDVDTGTSNLTGIVTAGKFQVQNISSSATTDFRGINASVSNTNGTLGSGYGGYFSTSTLGGTITNAYGVYTGSINGTNKWSFYASDATAPSYFAGNVGIGTTAPSRHLQISGNPGANIGEGLSILNTGAGGREFAFLQTDNTNTIGGGKFTIYDPTAVAHRFVIDSTGNVGVGTATPSEMLHLVKDGGSIFLQSTVLNSASRSAVKFGENDGVPRLSLSYDGSGPSPNNKLSIRDEAGAADLLTVVQNGNVGIGSNAPSAPLDVRGTWPYQMSVGATGNAGSIGFRRGADGSTSASVGMDLASGQDLKLWNGSGSGTIKMILGNLAPAFQVYLTDTNTNNRAELNSVFQINSPPVSPAAGQSGAAVLFWDSTTNKLKISENGGAFANLVGGGTSQWTTTGSDIYYTTGKVGIGIAAPVGKLDVQSDAQSTGVPNLRLSDPSSSGLGYNMIDFYSGGAAASLAQIKQINGAGYTASLTFNVADASKVMQERMIIDVNGNIGIGTTAAGVAPAQALHAIGGTTGPQTSGTTQQGSARFQGGTSSIVLDVGASTSGSSYGWLQTTNRANLATNYSLALNPNGGNVGVGTTNPSQSFEVYSSTVESIASLKSTANNARLIFDPWPGNSTKRFDLVANSGQFLIRDAWNAVNPVTIEQGVPANSLYMKSGGNVGIGTATPQATLDINGDIRLAKNASAPVTCSATYDGRIALTSQYTTCVCKGGSSAWVKTIDGTTACAW